MVEVVTNVVSWRGVVERKTANSLRISGLMWCHQESNRGHKDFQSFALPTELWHHRYVFAFGGVSPFLRCKGRGFIWSVQIFLKLFLK